MGLLDPRVDPDFNPSLMACEPVDQMSQVYSNPSREHETYALPDVEVFWLDVKSDTKDAEGASLPSGWYWWYCFPGCLPDGEPNGPFETEEAAIKNAQESNE